MKKIESKEEIKSILQKFDDVFSPPLSDDVSDLDLYANKLIKEAVTYVAEIGREESGFISFYVDDKKQAASFITLIAVSPNFQGQNLAQKLLDKCIQESRQKGKSKVRLEVEDHNERAIAFYEKNDFRVVEETSDKTVYMERLIV